MRASMRVSGERVGRNATGSNPPLLRRAVHSAFVRSFPPAIAIILAYLLSSMASYFIEFLSLSKSKYYILILFLL